MFSANESHAYIHYVYTLYILYNIYIYIYIYSGFLVVSLIPVVPVHLPFLYCNYPEALNSGKE